MRFLVLPLVAGLAFSTGMSFRHRLIDSLIFQPEAGIAIRPEQLGAQAEEVFLDTEDGVRIHGFFLPTLPTAGAPRALLFLHGNAGNASHRLPNAMLLARLGIHVLLLDYRGYGASEGRASEEGLYADARAGLAHLIDERGIDPDRIVVFGRSLGGAVAVDLAQDRELAGVVLESTFSSISDVARGMLGGLGAWMARGKFDSLAKIPRVRAPLLFFHGDRDEVIAHEYGRRLFDAAPEPKAFETLSGAGHNDTVQVGGARYFERIAEFIETVAPQRPAPTTPVP
jgi:fermentation-respiration switch protein FrsA (DUF1100 family)